jgi:polysaccharide pyruvyl transferase WcaK-like protein
MRSIGRDVTSDVVIPDLAFCLPVAADRSARTSDERTCVGLGVMTYFGWRNDPDLGQKTFDEYLAKLGHVVTTMLERGHLVRLLVGEGTDARAVAMLQELAEARFGSSVVADRLRAHPIEDLHALLDEIGRTDVVVATRYHNVVGALLAGRPVVSLGYAEKNRDLLRQVGLGDFCQDVESFDVDRVIADTECALARHHTISAELRPAVRRFARETAAQFDRLPVADTLRRTSEAGDVSRAGPTEANAWQPSRSEPNP